MVDNSGWYILKTLNERFERVITESMYSNMCAKYESGHIGMMNRFLVNNSYTNNTGAIRPAIILRDWEEIEKTIAIEFVHRPLLI